VDAPEGTAACPVASLSRTTVASTVGFPRESRISLPLTWIISVDMVRVPRIEIWL
jgi:hypothetical protein